MSTDAFDGAVTTVRDCLFPATKEFGADNVVRAACGAIAAIASSQQEGETTAEYYERFLDYTDRIVEAVNEIVADQNPELATQEEAAE